MTTPTPQPAGPQVSQPIVIGYDGGDSGADAVALGLRYAELVDATPIVTVIYPEPAAIGIGRVDAEWVADRRAEGEECLEGAKAVVAGLQAAGGANVAVEYRLVASSSAARGLSDLADGVRAGSLVVGSSAVEGGESRLFAGSTASRLLHGAAKPVALAPKGMRERRFGTPLTVGVAFIDTSEAKAALAEAAWFAALAPATLRVVTVVADEAAVTPWLIGADAEHAFSETAQESFGAAVDAAAGMLPSGLTVESELLVGDVVHELSELDVDILFCGSRGYGPVRSVLLGGVSSRLMRHAKHPIVVVPRQA